MIKKLQDPQVTTDISTNNAQFMKMETRGKGEQHVQAFSKHELHTQEGHVLRSLINAENDQWQKIKQGKSFISVFSERAAFKVLDAAALDNGDILRSVILI